MILVAGSANLDFVTRVPHLPAPGETMQGAAYRVGPGGKGANQAVACARASGGRVTVSFLGALGRDAAADTLRASLRENGVRDLTVSVPEVTGATFIGVSDAGENAILVAAGANALLLPEHLPGDLTPYRFLVLQLEIPLPTVLAYARRARAAGVQVILNAAPLGTDLPGELLAAVDELMVNAGKLTALAGRGEVREQLQRARRMGPGQVVVTLGSGVSLSLLEGGREVGQAAWPVTAVDTTGAGDTFVDAFAAALAEGQPTTGALKFAGRAAALTCTREGAQLAMPERSEIDALE